MQSLSVLQASEVFSWSISMCVRMVGFIPGQLRSLSSFSPLSLAPKQCKYHIQVTIASECPSPRSSQMSRRSCMFVEEQSLTLHVSSVHMSVPSCAIGQRWPSQKAKICLCAYECRPGNTFIPRATNGPSRNGTPMEWNSRAYSLVPPDSCRQLNDTKRLQWNSHPTCTTPIDDFVQIHYCKQSSACWRVISLETLKGTDRVRSACTICNIRFGGGTSLTEQQSWSW